MKKSLLAATGLILFSLCSGQSVKLTGEILDAGTKLPLHYASVVITGLKTGTIADKYGKFNFEVIPGDLKSDTLEFSFLGYERMKIPMTDFVHSNGTVFLKEYPVSLQEIKVLPKKYKVFVSGVTGKKPEHVQYANVFGANKGNFIGNDQKKTGWIKAVHYFLCPDGHPETPFRIRIYEPGSNNKPGRDLLNENVVVAASGPGWLSVDISEYKVQFPAEGAFVMMEWINSGAAFYFEKEVPVKGRDGGPDRMEKRTYYGQVLGTVSKKGGVTLWGSTLGNEWLPYDFSYRENYVQAMINIEVAYED